MLELLQGQLSDQVMAIVTDRHHGLFPQPGEMTLDCSCPDWAGMCKHVAAGLYGVGSRLDQQPELLFLLRGVDAEELIAAEIALPDADAVTAGDTLADEQLGAIFGIDLDTEADTDPAPQTPVQKHPRSTRRIAATKTRQQAHTVPVRNIAPATPPAGHSPHTARQGTRQKLSPPPATTPIRASAKVATGTPKIRPTGKSVARLRKKQELSVAQFAAQLGVSPATVYRWKATQGSLNLQARLLNALATLQQQSRLEVYPDPVRHTLSHSRHVKR
jgi:DNA-binding transcriptional regulator YiaG